MINITFQTIFNKLNVFPALLKKNAINEAQRSAEECAQIARSLVPVDTGALKSSIRVERDEELGWSVVVGDGDDTTYGHFVEYGTVHQAAQPYMTPASEQTRSPFLIHMGEVPEKVAQAISG